MIGSLRTLDRQPGVDPQLGKSLLGVGDEVLGKNVEMAKLRLQRHQTWEQEAAEDSRTSVSRSPGHEGPGPGPKEAALKLSEGHAPTLGVQ